MILSSLVELYESLVQKGKLQEEGWSKAKISYAVYLEKDGSVQSFLKIKNEKERKGKKIEVPQSICLPTAVKRASNIAANFLWDNASYIFGISSEGMTERSQRCFEACKSLHQAILQDVDCDEARAICNFFEKRSAGDISGIPSEDLIDLYKGANITFMLGEKYVYEAPKIREAWNRYYHKGDEYEKGQCLVTGEETVIAKLHPSIKGVRGAQSSGASLVSFNASAFESYGKEQGMKSPVGRYAAFAYTEALNYLLENAVYFGDTAVVAWVRDGQEEYEDFLFESLTDYDLIEKLRSLSRGKAIYWEDTILEPQKDFYILGIAPNAARLSIRFFWMGNFGRLAGNVERHYKRLEIARSEYDKYKSVSVGVLLSETVRKVKPTTDQKDSPNDGAGKPKVSSVLVGAVLRAIFSDTEYPAQLIQAVMLRIRAERNINANKAAIIKAFYLKNKNILVPQEVLKEDMNEESKEKAYVLGRLFALLDQIQDRSRHTEKDTKEKKDNDSKSTTIRGRYWNSAAATPAMIFPLLLKLTNSHMRKLKEGSQEYYDRRLTDLMSRLGEEFPQSLSLEQQGVFYLGYYFENKARYEKKEDKKYE